MSNFEENDDLGIKDTTISSLETYIENLKPTDESIVGLYSELPSFIQKVIDPYENQDARLISLIGSITVLSSLTAKASFILRKRRISPMISTIIFAPPSSEKGLVKYSALLTKEVDKKLQNTKLEELARYNVLRKQYEKQIKQGVICTQPVYPTLQLLTFPANATSVSILEQLNHNGENHGLLLVELELDIYVNSAKKDHGNQNSAMLRLIGEQEPIRAATKSGGEVFVDVPKAAILFVGTMSQVTKLFFSNDDGLFSRFMFFEFGGNPTFDLELDSNEMDFGSYAKIMGLEFEKLYNHSLLNHVSVDFTDEQLQELQDFGSMHYKYLHEFMSENAGSLLKRHVNFVCRIAAVLRLVEYYETEDNHSTILVTDKQFEAAMILVRLSLYNSIKLFQKLPGERPNVELNEKLQFYDYLPNEFTSDAFKGEKIPFSVSERTVYNWIKSFIHAGLIIKESQNHYRKVK